MTQDARQSLEGRFARLRERLAHPDQELLDVITEYLLEEHDDPVRELDLLAMLNTLH